MPQSRRERKRLHTRTELVGSARSLIAESGVAALRVSDVTDRSDVALGSFYSHFQTKDDIVEAVVAGTVAALADAIGDVGDHLEDPAEAMSVGIRKLVGLCHGDPELARLLVHLGNGEHRFQEMIWDRAYRIMERGVAAGRFRAADPVLMLTVAIAGVFATIRAIVERQVGEGVAEECTVALLCMVGIDHDRARDIARRPLPELNVARTD